MYGCVQALAYTTDHAHWMISDRLLKRNDDEAIRHQREVTD